jgi:thiamine-phosphate pyrophosphorylase
MALSERRPLICLVTDRRRLAETSPSTTLVDLVRAAAYAGVDLIQIRERDLEAHELTETVAACVAAVRGTPAEIVVNDRADVAVAAGAHGVHLRSDSYDARRVRQLLAPGGRVGRSVHSGEEAVAASRSGGLDYLILGTLFPTPSKKPSHRLTTMTGLAAACALSSLPVIAIGGITVQRAGDVARSGAAGIAAIGLFIPPEGTSVDDHLQTSVSGLRRAFDSCGAVP